MKNEDVWVRLISEGNFELINRLHRAEKFEPGFCTIVVTKEGFSENDITHNLVLSFLKKKKIHYVNPNLENARIDYFLQNMKIK